MSQATSNRFVLVGPLEGKTLNLGGHDFIDGVYEFVYVQDGIRVLPSQEDVRLKARALARNYQAFPEGSPELEAAAKQLSGAKASEPAEGDTSKSLDHETEGQTERDNKPVTDRQAKTAARSALLKLDAENDEHWTDAGKPSVAAVRAIAGVESISRADIEALAPKLTREEARRIAKGE